MLGCQAESRNMYFTITRNSLSSPVKPNNDAGLLTQGLTTSSNSLTLVFTNYIPMSSGAVSNLVLSFAALFSLLAVFAF